MGPYRALATREESAAAADDNSSDPSGGVASETYATYAALFGKMIMSREETTVNELERLNALLAGNNPADVAMVTELLSQIERSCTAVDQAVESVTVSEAAGEYGAEHEEGAVAGQGDEDRRFVCAKCTTDKVELDLPGDILSRAAGEAKDFLGALCAGCKLIFCGLLVDPANTASGGGGAFAAGIGAGAPPGSDKKPGALSTAQMVDEIDKRLHSEAFAARTAELERVRAEEQAGNVSIAHTEDFHGKSYAVDNRGWIDVQGNVELAAELLGQGRRVRLNQEDEVRTLIELLAEKTNASEEQLDQEKDRIKALQDAGQLSAEQARAAIKEAESRMPNFNLCDVSVPDTNLFCIDSKDIPRPWMPQFSANPVHGSLADQWGDNGSLRRDDEWPDPITGKGGVDMTLQFEKYLTDKLGVNIAEAVEVPASSLSASQNELNGRAVAQKTLKLRKQLAAGESATVELLVSRDNYIVDGHHRWASLIGADLMDGKLDGAHDGKKITLKVRRIDMEIVELLAVSSVFTEAVGLPSQAMAAAKGGCGC